MFSVPSFEIVSQSAFPDTKQLDSPSSTTISSFSELYKPFSLAQLTTRQGPKIQWLDLEERTMQWFEGKSISRGLPEESIGEFQENKRRVVSRRTIADDGDGCQNLVVRKISRKLTITL